MTIALKNQTGAVKKAPTGFSWTMLFFGCFVPLLRGDIKWFLISLFAGFITIGLSWLVMPFIYNKRYVSNLLENGFIPLNQVSQNELVSRGLFVSNSDI